MTALDSIKELQTRMGQSVIGQQQVIDSLLLGLLANGNLLLLSMFDVGRSMLDVQTGKKL